MARVAFKAKPETVYNHDETVAYQRIKVPALTRAHCDMSAFRRHPKLGSYANSDLFPSILKRAVKTLGIPDYIRLDQVPAGIAIDTSGFLHVVSFDL